MELKKVKVNGNEYTFASETFSNSRNLGHRTTLFKGDSELGDARHIYINRTWESFRYQSIMLSCVRNIINGRLERYIERYKSDNNISRFKKGQREIVEQEFYNLDNIKELKAVYEIVSKGEFIYER